MSALVKYLRARPNDPAVRAWCKAKKYRDKLDMELRRIGFKREDEPGHDQYVAAITNINKWDDELMRLQGIIITKFGGVL